MSSNATLRELKAGLEDSTTMAVTQPWSFRPMDAEAWRCRSEAWGRGLRYRYAYDSRKPPLVSA